MQMDTDRQVQHATGDRLQRPSCPAYTLKIRGGCDTYLKADGKVGTAGKGALIQTELSATLGASQDQYLFVGVDLYNQCLTGRVSKTLNNKATDADHVPCVLVKDDT